MAAKLWCILRAASLSFMKPVLVGALWWVGRAGLTLPVNATRRGEEACATAAAGRSCSATAGSGCSATARVEADATMPDW
jgi:hypothetical protein